MREVGPDLVLIGVCCSFFSLIFTDHISGPGTAIGPLCVCLYPTITIQLNDR